MVDTFELPSACVCHYKESFGFDSFGLRDLKKRSAFHQRITMPYRFPDCRNGGVLSQPVKRQFREFIWSPQIPIYNIPFTSNMPSANFRPTRYPHTSERYFLKQRKHFTPIQCREVNFGDVCKYKSSFWQRSHVGRYPTSIIRNIMRRNSTYRSPRQFEKFFGKACTLKETTRIGFSVGLSFDESPLCRGETRYIFPKVARNINGTTRFIVNTQEYKQGVTVVECHPDATGIKTI